MRLSSLFNDAYVKSLASVRPQPDDGDQPDLPEILYNPDTDDTPEDKSKGYRTVAEFEEHDDRQKFLDQLGRTVGNLRKFLEENEREKESGDFGGFVEDVKVGSAHELYEQKIALIYNQGMIALHRIDKLSPDEDIPIKMRVDEIANLAVDIRECGPAAVKHAEAVVSKLTLAKEGGLINHATITLLSQSEQAIREFVKKRHEPSLKNVRRHEIYESEEVHLVEYYKSAAAKWLWGDITDEYVTDQSTGTAMLKDWEVTDESVADCKRVHDGLVNGDSLVSVLGTQCLSETRVYYRERDLRNEGNEESQANEEDEESEDHEKGHKEKKLSIYDLDGELAAYEAGDGIQFRLAKKFGRVEFDDVFSAAYLPYLDRESDLEERGLVNRDSLLRYRIAKNLEAAGALEDVRTESLTEASSNSETVEKTGNSIFLRQHTVSKARELIDAEDLYWISDNWRASDRTDLVPIASEALGINHPADLSYALKNGDAGAVRDYIAKIRSLDDATRATLLDTHEENGTSALYDALRRGHTEAIRAYTEGVRSLPIKVQSRLLEAFRPTPNDPNKIALSGISIALAGGHADAIRAYLEAIQLLDSAEQARLLDPIAAKGWSGVAIALGRGHSDAIRAFSEAISGLEPSVRAKYLEAKDVEGVPGLHHALANGHSDAIRAYGEALAGVDPKLRAQYLDTRDENGLSGLYRALYQESNGDEDDALLPEHRADAIRAYGDALQSVDHEAKVALLDTEKSRFEMSGLSRAIAHGEGETVRAYVGVLRRAVDKDAQAKLLEAGKNGFALAIGDGEVSTVSAYIDAIHPLDVKVRRRILEAGGQNLADAMRQGNATTITLYAGAVEQLDRDPDSQSRLLGMKGEHAGFVLATGVKEGQWQAVEAYLNAIRPFDIETYKRVTPMVRKMRGLGAQGLSDALAKGDADFINSYAKFLDSVGLNSEDRAKLLECNDGLKRALEKGHGRAIKAYAAAIGSLDPRAQARLLRVPAGSGLGGQGLWRALSEGHTEAVEAYVDALRPLEGKTRAKYLKTGNIGGRTGLSKCLFSGHDKTVRPYVHAVVSLDHEGSEKDKLDILEGRADEDGGIHAHANDAFQIHSDDAFEIHVDDDARSDDGRSRSRLSDKSDFGLTLAIKQGHDDAVYAFLTELAPLEEPLKRRLVEARQSDGTPALSHAIRRGDAKTVLAYAEALDYVDYKESRIDILSARNKDGVSELEAALLKGDTHRVDGCVGAYSSLAYETRTQLFEAPDAHGAKFLTRAFSNGMESHVRSYVKMVRSEAFGDQARLLTAMKDQAHLLTAMDADGTPGLTRAIELNRVSSVRTFAEEIKRLPVEIKVHIADARDKDGRSALARIFTGESQSLHEVNTAFSSQFKVHHLPEMSEKLMLYREVMSTIPEEHRAGILRAADADGVPLLARIREAGDANAERRYTDFIKSYAPDLQRELLEDIHSRSGVDNAGEDGRDRGVRDSTTGEAAGPRGVRRPREALVDDDETASDTDEESSRKRQRLGENSRATAEAASAAPPAPRGVRRSRSGEPAAEGEGSGSSSDGEHSGKRPRREYDDQKRDRGSPSAQGSLGL